MHRACQDLTNSDGSHPIWLDWQIKDVFFAINRAYKKTIFHGRTPCGDNIAPEIRFGQIPKY